MIVFFRNGIFRSKPEILPGIQRIIKTGPCKAADRLLCIMYSLQNPRPCKVMNQFPDLCPILGCKYKLCLTGASHFYLRIFIHISICMSRQCNRFLPIAYTWLNSLYNNRCPKYRTVQCRPNRPIGTFPHFLQMIFFHTSCIRSNRCTFDCHTIFLCGQCTIQCHLIFRFISILQPQIIIFRLQINIREQ